MHAVKAPIHEQQFSDQIYLQTSPSFFSCRNHPPCDRLGATIAIMHNGKTERSRRTLYVTGYNPDFTSKRLLEELFLQGGPVVDVTMLENHAYVLFNDEESVSYCLALFKDVELHGQKLTLHSRSKDKRRFDYLKYLMQVRDKLMSEYCKLPPPDLPAKKVPEQKSFVAIQKKPKIKSKNKRRVDTRKTSQQHRSRNLNQLKVKHEQSVKLNPPPPKVSRTTTNQRQSKQKSKKKQQRSFSKSKEAKARHKSSTRKR